MIVETLAELRDLLRKYGFHGQADIIQDILDRHSTDTQDFVDALQGVAMWGGAGAVWEVGDFTENGVAGPRAKADRRRFMRAIISLAQEMDRADLGTDRSRFIAATFSSWLDKELV